MSRWMSRVAMSVALGWLMAATGVTQQKGILAATPPMGWNSWDAYGLTITEAQFRANVEVLAKRLKPAGYEYAVIDEGWFMRNPQDRPTPEKLEYELDAYGRYIPVTARFASAVNAAGTNDGFKALGDSPGEREAESAGGGERLQGGGCGGPGGCLSVGSD